MKTRLLLALLVCAACRAPQKETGSGDAPMATRETSIWGYLEAKYDDDRDGVILVTDYDRGTESFSRLDQNDDGKLTEQDFRSGGRMHVFVAQMMIMRNFHDDEEYAVLTIEEVRACFVRADKNGDGALALAEFEQFVAAAVVPADAPAPRAMPPGMNPYDSMLRAMDRDRSGHLQVAEFEVFFEERDSDKNGTWEPRARTAPREVTASGVAEGLDAPDFALHPPGGGEVARLSAHRGARPVALIFGSYT